MLTIAGNRLDDVEEVLAKLKHFRVDMLDKGHEAILISQSPEEEHELMTLLEDIGIHYLKS